MAEKTRKQILIEKRNALNTLIRQEANKEAAAKRKEDTRRKILVGAFILDRADKDEQYQGWLIKGLDGFLTRTDDRDLFGLAPLPPPAAGDPAPVDSKEKTE